MIPTPKMFKNLKKKLEDGAQKVVQQVSSPNASQSQATEGNLIDIEQPSTQSTPIPSNKHNNSNAKAAASSSANSRVCIYWCILYLTVLCDGHLNIVVLQISWGFYHGFSFMDKQLLLTAVRFTQCRLTYLLTYFPIDPNRLA